MNEAGSDFYNISEAARLLCLTPKEVLRLINEGALNARPGEQSGNWLIEARSVHTRLKEFPPRTQGPEVTPMATSPLPKSPRQENRVWDLLVLVAIGGMTLLAAGYTLLPTLSGGESTQPQETTAGTAAESTQPGTAAESTQPDTTDRTVVVPQTDTPPPITTPAHYWVDAVGDSVMLGAVDALHQEIPNLVLLNAQGSRQPPAAVGVLQQLHAAGHLGESVVVHVGNNGPFTNEQFDEMMQELADVRKVLIVNLTVPPEVEDPIALPNNAVLAEGVQRYPNTVLVDWHSASIDHPEFLGEDGTHLTLEGAQAYAGLIGTYLEDTEGSVELPGPQETVSWGEGGAFGECVGPPSWCIDSP
jgi:hypothetical protein